MADILADRDVPERVCAFLRSYGHSVVQLTIRDIGRDGKGADDEDVLSCAATERRAVLTCNWTDYKNLHARGARHEGIVQCPSQRNERVTAQAIDQAIRDCLAQHPTLHMQLVPVAAHSQRLRSRRQRPS
ncbi:MAG: DUF5615 family PIN-like protein [Planctomycetaceae bacterium]|nr:DUF5615 family PIN-like protein [Planctomycetaceae bacterium]